MGKTLSIWAVLITVLLAGFSYTNTPLETPKEDYNIVDNSVITISVNSDEDFRFFLKAEFDETEDEIKFLTKESTTQIRIYDQLDDMVYLLPVGSDKIRIGKSLFSRGNYKFIFDIEDSNEMHTTNISVH